jgi:hypothetical protein
MSPPSGRLRQIFAMPFADLDILPEDVIVRARKAA